MQTRATGNISINSAKQGFKFHRKHLKYSDPQSLHENNRSPYKGHLRPSSVLSALKVAPLPIELEETFPGVIRDNSPKDQDLSHPFTETLNERTRLIAILDAPAYDEPASKKDDVNYILDYDWRKKFGVEEKTPLERVLSIMSWLRTLIKDPPENLTEELVGLFNRLAKHHQSSADHSARVAEEAFHIGLDLELPPKKLFKLVNSAFLHDLGKIGVPVETLDYPGKPSPEQWDQIRAHPEIGYTMLKEGTHLPNEIIGLHGVLEHHVWLNRSERGYPNIPSGEKLSFIARIIEVADVYDALTDPNRAYRKPASSEEALKFIIRGINTQFDEKPVQALVKIKGYDIDKLRKDIGIEDELKAATTQIQKPLALSA